MSLSLKHFLLISFSIFSGFLSQAQISLYSFEEIIINSTGDAHVNGFITFNNEIYFSAKGDNNIDQLWKTDGTTSGTIKLTNFNYMQSMRFYTHQIYDDKLYFIGDGNGTGSGDNPEIWVTEGTVASTQIFYTDSTGGEFNDFYIFKNHIYLDYNHYLGVYDIMNNSFNTYEHLYSPEGTFIELLDKLYITANYNFTGERLFHIENTIADTTFTNPNIEVLSRFHEYNGDIYIIGKEGSFIGLMTYNPSTGIFSQISAANSYTSMQNFNNELYFTGQEATNGSELWKTDGTTSELVKDIEPGIDGSIPLSLGTSPIIINNELYFSAHTSNYGREIWRTDGTDSGTELLAETITGQAPLNNSDYSNSLAESAVYFNSLLFFNAYEAQEDFQIFAIDPISSEIMRITPDSLDNDNAVHEYTRNNLIKLDTTLLMGAKFSSNGYQLWKMTPSQYVNIDEFNNNPIQVFTDDQKNIHLTQSSNETLVYSIIDMNGRTHMNGQFDETEQIINLSNLYSGFYILKLVDDKNKIKTIKFSLQ